MASSQLGIRRERQVKQILESHGWWVCRAAGSLGDADLVALHEFSHPMLIEVKATSRGPFAGFSPSSRAELIVAAGCAGAVPMLAYWPSRGRLQWISADAWPGARLEPGSLVWARAASGLPTVARAEEAA